MARNYNIKVTELFSNSSDIGNNYLHLLYIYILLDQYANCVNTMSNHGGYQDRAHRPYERPKRVHRAPACTTDAINKLIKHPLRPSCPDRAQRALLRPPTPYRAT